MTKLTYSFLLFFLFSVMMFAQETFSFESVRFEKTEVYLDEAHAYNYSIDENYYFEITNLKGEKLITGKITPLGNKKFASQIHFVTVDRMFSNPTIIGRNDLILNLNTYGVIQKNFELNDKKLNQFIDEFNGQNSSDVKIID